MSKKKMNDLGPNRRMVEQLLRTLDTRYRYRNDPRVDELDDKLKEMHETVNNLPEYVTIKKQRDDLKKKLYRSGELIEKRIKRVREKYLANGITPTVLKELDQLVELTNPKPTEALVNDLA